MIENKPSRTELSDLGEFGLINAIAKNIKLKHSSSIRGIGDDAAVVNNAGRLTIISTDMLLENIHFDLSYIPLKHLGYKAVTVNLSDIYAMNAIPKQILVSLAFSNRFSLEAIEELYEGISLACDVYGIDLIGGDTSSTVHGLIISVTAIGEAEKEDLVYRDGAKETDLICVTGDLGAAFIGLQLLEREKRIFLDNPSIQPDLGGNDYILERQLKPEAQQEIIRILKQIGVKPTSMIDISDGLSSELFHICQQSNVGCTIYEDKIPIDPQTYALAQEFNLDPTVCALSGGEDYELLFTIAISDYEKVRTVMDVSLIGHVNHVSEGKNLISSSGSSVELKAQGWNAFPKE